VTTSSGTFLRIAILQFRFTALDQGAEAEVSIEQQLQAFGSTVARTEALIKQWSVVLGHSADAFAKFDESLRTAYAEVVEHHKASIAAIGREHQDLVGRTLASSASAIKVLAEGLSGRLSSAISDALAPLKGEAAETAESFKKANASLRRSLPNFTKGMDSASAEFERSETSLAGLGDSIMKAREAILNLALALDGTVKTFEQSSADVVKANARVMDSVGENAAKALKEALGSADWRQVITLRVDQDVVAGAVRDPQTSVQSERRITDDKLDLCVAELRRLTAGLSAAGDRERAAKSDEANLKALNEIRDVLHKLSEKRGIWPFG